ncbi:MAG: glycosyltransferase [Chromatiales bacterium]|jgi:MGT family glycosyltransferase
MATFLYFCLPFVGHIHPAMALVSELRALDHEVIFCTSNKRRTMFQDAGLAIRGIDLSRLEALIGHPHPGRHLIPSIIADTRTVINPCLAIIKEVKPSLVITEPLAAWGSLVAKTTHIPLVIAHTTFVQNAEYNLVRKQQDLSGQRGRSWAMSNIPKVATKIAYEMLRLHLSQNVDTWNPRKLLRPAGDLHVAAIPAALQPGSENLDERYNLTGPWLRKAAAAPHEESIAVSDQPLIYIALGTVFTNKPPLFHACIEAVADMPVRVVISSGNFQLDSVPSNCEVFPFVDQIAILRQASAFLTHGGPSSVFESAICGVPMVAMPHMGDQRVLSDMIERYGAGIVIKDEIPNAGKIKQALESVLNDDSFRQNTRNLGKICLEGGGARRAAILIDDFQRDYLDKPNVA